MTTDRRAAIADLTHEIVCAATHSDGFGHCAVYALAGSLLVTFATSKIHIPQAGTLRLLHDRPDLVGGGYLVASHFWIVGPLADPEREGPLDLAAMDLIDFSARHYRRMVEEHLLAVARVLTGVDKLGCAPYEWNRPNPPPFLWVRGACIPDWLVFQADSSATADLYGIVTERLPNLMPLVREKGKRLRAGISQK
jgi:hypothetical protein